MEEIRRKTPASFSLPRRIQRLGELSYNLWWVWNHDAQGLYRMIDKPLWDMVSHNPIAFLQQVQRPLLNKAVNETAFLDKYDAVMEKFDALYAVPRNMV